MFFARSVSVVTKQKQEGMRNSLGSIQRDHAHGGPGDFVIVAWEAFFCRSLLNKT